MVGRALLKIFNMISGEFESKLADGFKMAMLQQIGLPFPTRELKNLLSEMPFQKKKAFASYMNIQIRSQPNKPFSDDQLVKLIRTKTKTQTEKARFLKGLMNSIINIYGDINNLSPEVYLSGEEEKTKEFGPWHYYWGLRLFPIKNEVIEKRRVELEEHLPDSASPRKESVAKVIPLNPKQEEKKSKESSIISRERELRQKAEQVAEGLKSKIRTLEKNQVLLKQEKKNLLFENKERDKKLNETEDALSFERTKTHTLEREKIELNFQIKKLKKTIEQLTENEKDLRRKFEEKLAALRQELTVPELQLTDLAEKLVVALNKDVDDYYIQLRSGQALRQDQSMTRKKICDCLELIESLEVHFSLVPLPADVDTSLIEPALVVRVPKPDYELDEHNPVEEKTNSRRYLGTFFRREHGGYIVLDNNEMFNITESMVNSIGLEHEAEVECDPSSRPDGSIQHNIRLLLQGDDDYAPMTQYMGYVELGEHFTYYCVDMNNSNIRFPLYEKDFEIQKPQDGDPCLFNVAIGGEYARLSKVYKRSPIGKPTKDQLVNEKSISARTKRKNDRIKQEAFLGGCKIVILGGLEKWFESVVKETGAELFHENGSNPDRIHPKLRRADALFVLETATSHEAFWSCIDIAKENNIPHFRIEGSKSNLRKLLRDNRDIIRKGKMVN